jgi:hypothetical protein
MWDRIAQDTVPPAGQGGAYSREREAMKEKVCVRCKASTLRRVNRMGFVQSVLLPMLGYFPWECAVCRRKMFFRDDGRRGDRPV